MATAPGVGRGLAASALHLYRISALQRSPHVSGGEDRDGGNADTTSSVGNSRWRVRGGRRSGARRRISIRPDHLHRLVSGGRQHRRRHAADRGTTAGATRQGGHRRKSRRRRRRAGSGDVVKAAPDGRTLLASASSLAANPTLVKVLAFDTLKDLQAVALIFRTPLVLVVNPKLPVHSMAELMALLKAKPGQINFGHGGPGSAIHLAGELFQVMTGTEMTGVSYRGAPLGAQRRHGRSRRADVRRCRQRHGADQSRHGAAARRVLDDPRSGAARCSDHRRGGRAWLRRGRLDLDLRARGNAEADRRAAERGTQGGCRSARGAMR